MSKSVLISIQPQWCDLIANGLKTIEVRKTRPKLETPFKCYIYCTLPRKSGDSFLAGGKHPVQGNGKVIGEFVCNKIEEIRQREVFNADVLCSTTCLTIKEFLDYIGNATAYLWHISDLVIYDKPKEIDEFSNYKKYDWWDYGHHKNKPQWELRKLSRPPQSWCYVESKSDNKKIQP